MEFPFAPLSEACAKTLWDKTYDKRKIAATEIEKMVQEFNSTKNYTQIRKLIKVLGQDFATSKDNNKRKGGLLGLAATSIGLGKDTEKFAEDLVSPVLNCLCDPEVRVRLFASESLYNIVKVARGSIIPLFPRIFSALSRLVTDSDENCKNGSELLDRLLKDIVTESPKTFDLDAFIPLLRERIYAKNSFSRQFVISWISVLNAVPEINMIIHLPEILDGLFQMLDDNSVEIHTTCDTLLSEFLKSIKNDPNGTNMPEMCNILINHAQSNNALIQSTAIGWIREFVQLSGPQMLKFASGIFTAILPCLAYDGDSRRDIKKCAQAVNMNLFELTSSRDAFRYLELDSIMKVLQDYLIHSSANSVDTKVAVLKWIHHLFTQAENEMSAHAHSLYPVLFETLSNDSDEVVIQGLTVLAEIVNSTNPSKDASSSHSHYKKFLNSLLRLFDEKRTLLENRGAFIISQLCILLDAELIYRMFAEIIFEESANLKFASTMVRTLNTILLTTTELFQLRMLLKDITNEKSASLFECLYMSWAHCPVSTLSLCLLAQCYQHVSQLVILFGEIEITVEFLIEMDKLVQLIESPIFASLRLSLVSQNTAEAQYLSRALFGILMLLPQTEAFTLLKNRLQCIPHAQAFQNEAFLTELISQFNSTGKPNFTFSDTSKLAEKRSGIDFTKLFKHFQEVQKNHHEYRRNQRKRNFFVSDRFGSNA